MNEIHIRLLAPTDDLSELTRLLNRSYKKMADRGFSYLAASQDVEMTKKRIQEGKCFVATLENKIIGTICYYFPVRASAHKWYNQPFVASYGQFAVASEFQKQGVGNALIQFVEKLALQDGAMEISIDTAENATELVNYYKKKGYRFVDHAQWETANYRSVVLSKRLK